MSVMPSWMAIRLGPGTTTGGMVMLVLVVLLLAASGGGGAFPFEAGAMVMELAGVAAATSLHGGPA